MGYKKDLILKLSQQLKEKGFRVFIAKSSEHGFYTDNKGSKVISISCDLGIINASANYKTSKPKETGSGYRITDDFNAEKADSVFSAYPPNWALCGATFKYTTLDEHLETYGLSSGYKEI